MGLRDIFRAVLRRDRAFKINDQVVAESYMREGAKVRNVDPKMVEACAATLESALVMSETLPPGHVMSLDFSVDELNSFVCYMRQLDTTYRQQAEFIERHIKPSESPGEFKTSEEAAPVSPELYAQLTGKSAGDPSLRFARELAEVSKGHISLAEAERLFGERS